MTLQSAALTGLAPGTLYHYRLRATQLPGFPDGLVCPDEDVRQGNCPELEHTFRTYLPGEAKPDERGYELVSPAEKNSAEVVGSSQNGRGIIDDSAVLIQAGAASGEAVTYTSWISFANAQGAPATSQYLSRRTPSGWTHRQHLAVWLSVEHLRPPLPRLHPGTRLRRGEGGGNAAGGGLPGRSRRLLPL